VDVEEDDPFLRPGGPQADAPRPLGEIVVSAETALRQAPEQGCDPVRETFLYVVHGVLHLLGYDDRTPETARRMAERQEEILESWMRISGDTI
ncbi:MAG: rRNA maturation RNase YbeY, partial [Planctomycetota bacterium]